MNGRATKAAASSPAATAVAIAEATILSLDDISEIEERETLASLCTMYRDESGRERAAKSSKDALMGEIAPLAEKLGIEDGKAKLVLPAEQRSEGGKKVPGWELVQRKYVGKAEIDPKRLLARGVSMEDIQYATVAGKETPYYTVLGVK